MWWPFCCHTQSPTDPQLQLWPTDGTQPSMTLSSSSTRRLQETVSLKELQGADYPQLTILYILGLHQARLASLGKVPDELLASSRIRERHLLTCWSLGTVGLYVMCI